MHFLIFNVKNCWNCLCEQRMQQGWRKKIFCLRLRWWRPLVNT